MLAVGYAHSQTGLSRYVIVMTSLHKYIRENKRMLAVGYTHSQQVYLGTLLLWLFCENIFMEIFE